MRIALLAAILLPTTSFAQVQLKLPDASPKATVSQTIGLTDITVSYHRPAVKKRAVWGGLVPYGEVWRAGANQNTTVTFTSPVTVEGKPVAAGTYGLHFFPTNTSWTLILSNVTTGWGSFSYDQKDDALRVPVTGEAAPFLEWLDFTFDDLTENSGILALHWEKLRIPIHIGVDTNKVVAESLRGQLRGLAQFFPKNWGDAAGWLLRHDTSLDLAGQWAEKSISMQPTYAGLHVKAALLEKKGDTAAAAGLREKAIALASEVELNLAAYHLLQEKKMDKALELFRKNISLHPESWNAHDSLGEALVASGDKSGGAAEYQRALEMVKDEAQKKRITKTLGELR